MHPAEDCLAIHLISREGPAEIHGVLSTLDFGVPSFPRRRESRGAIWIPAGAGMTSNPNSRS